MCGIFVSSGSLPEADARKAADLFAYRGPDGTNINVDSGTILIHHRLAIIDPQPRANQPLWNENKTIGVVFNGEIYNFRELRKEFSDTSFKTEGDTEVLLKLYEKYGASCGKFLDGMYAAVFIDKRSNSLVALRDPFGIKPLYYTHNSSGIIFASEIKGVVSAMRATGHPVAMTEDVIDIYTTIGYVPSPRTIVKDVFSVPPGYSVTYAFDSKKVLLTNHASDVRVDNHREPNDVITTLTHSIKGNTVADVPLGLFLSGGIDSTFIAHVLHKEHIQATAFTLSIPRRDDLQYAQEVASHYKIPHQIVDFTQQEFDYAYKVVRERIDTPTADSSLLPTYALSRHARKSVAVVLSGEGSDEIFYGYNRHSALAGMRSRRAFLGSLLESDLPRSLLQSMSTIFGDAVSYYALTAGIEPTRQGTQDLATYILSNEYAPLEYDRLLYLENDLLRKIDLATMYNSLEGRVPFCSPDVLRAARAQGSRLLSNGTKTILKSHLAESLPHDLIYRPKSGFSIPFTEYEQYSPLVQEDLAHLKDFLSKRFEEKSDWLLRATKKNHYARFGMLSLMHVARNLGL